MTSYRDTTSGPCDSGPSTAMQRACARVRVWSQDTRMGRFAATTLQGLRSIAIFVGCVLAVGIVLAVGTAVISGPFYLAQATGSDAWLYLYMLHGIAIAYGVGKDIEYKKRWYG